MVVAALRESVVDYVIFSGEWEQYPSWFREEVLDGILVDENRYTRYIPKPNRAVDYYDKIMVEDYSVFLRKRDTGNIHCTTYDVFEDLYAVMDNNPRTNSGIAAFREDTIEIVECHGGLPESYPSWFYNFFSDGRVIKDSEETILFYGDDREISITGHSYFLRNKNGQVAHMDSDTFDKYYIREGLRRF